MGWEMGFEPTNAGTTIRCLRPLGDTHQIFKLRVESEELMCRRSRLIKIVPKAHRNYSTFLYSLPTAGKNGTPEGGAMGAPPVAEEAT